MFYVYAIKSFGKNYIYVGITDNIERRLSQHNSGENKSTKAYKPFIIIHSESFATRPEARMKEIYFKSGVGKEHLKTVKLPAAMAKLVDALP